VFPGFAKFQGSNNPSPYLPKTVSIPFPGFAKFQVVDYLQLMDGEGSVSIPFPGFAKFQGRTQSFLKKESNVSIPFPGFAKFQENWFSLQINSCFGFNPVSRIRKVSIALDFDKCG
jgi:hypothetical protein